MKGVRLTKRTIDAIPAGSRSPTSSGRRGTCYGGWDYGSGPSRLVCLMGLLEWGNNPRLWVEWDLWWQQTAWQTAAADVREKLALYPGGGCHFGDPAGIQRESDQSSWEQNLRSGGVPLMRLHHTERPRDGKRYRWDTREGIEWMIKEVQLWLDDGRLIIHRRCKYLWSCLESWSWNIPQGAEVDELSRAYIGPRKDVYSHGANALMYLVAGVANVIATTRWQEREGHVELTKNRNWEMARYLMRYRAPVNL